jgi:hypothetical protein
MSNARQFAMQRTRATRDIGDERANLYYFEDELWEGPAVELARLCNPLVDFQPKPGGKMKGEPRIVFETPPFLSPKNPTKSNYPRYIESVNMFTLTSKMGCASFSLPAGVPSVGGTCSMAGAGKTDNFICHGCYAIINNYDYDNVFFAAAARLVWVRNVLDYGGADALASILAQGIEVFHNLLIKQKRPQKGQADPSYFRIHDAGDVGVLDLEYDMDYSRAWWRVAAMLPHITFWMPTRDWANRTWLRRYERLVHEVPENLIIRPSALQFEGTPPILGDNFDAGTTSGVEPDIADVKCEDRKSVV